MPTVATVSSVAELHHPARAISLPVMGQSPVRSCAAEPAPIGLQSPQDFFRDIYYVTLKVTNGCNLKCSYCNVEADHPSTPKMSMETFRQIADLLIQNSRSPQVGLEFHGGEPMLLSDEWYTQAVTYAQDLGRRHQKTVIHPMQTNATLLTEQRQRHLQGLGIQIGFSFDGPPEINDRYRMAGKMTERAIKRFVAEKRSFGMILVLGPGNCGEMYRVMEYFREIGIQDYRVNFLQPQGWGQAIDTLSDDQMFEGMRSVFDHMADTGCSVIEGETQLAVNRMVEGRLRRPALTCWELECQAGRTYCAVNHRGEVFACGTDMSKHKLGDVFEGFEAAQVRATLSRLHHKDPWYVRCFDCEAKRICHFSCPTTDYNDETYRDHSCSFTRRMYSYLSENFERVQRVYDILRTKRPGPALR